jgi:hypothetical protein
MLLSACTLLRQTDRQTDTFAHLQVIDVLLGQHRDVDVHTWQVDVLALAELVAVQHLGTATMRSVKLAVGVDTT